MTQGGVSNGPDPECRSAGRRRFLRSAATMAVGASIATACRRRVNLHPGVIRFDGWGGVVQDAVHRYGLAPFERATGIEVVEGTFDDETTFVNQVLTSELGDFNVVQSSGLIAYKRYVDLGYASRIDEANVPNLGLVMAPMTAAMRRVTPRGLSAVPYSYGTSGIAYNTRYFHESDLRREGWGILLSRELRGKIGALDDMLTRVWYAALQSGQDPNAIADMAAVWDKARQGLGVVRKYWDSGAELMDLLANEEILITDAYSGRIAAMQRQGYPIGYYAPPGTLGWIDSLLVLKGSPMRDCEALLNFMLQPAVATAVAESEFYAPSLDPTRIAMPDSIRKLPTFDATGTLAGIALADPLYWSQHYQRWERQWHHILRGA